MSAQVQPITVKSYEQVEGLVEIYVSLDKTPAATFVFKSTEMAKMAAQGVFNGIQFTNAMSTCESPKKRTNILEVALGTNISKAKEELTLNYIAEGKSISCAKTLLDKLGKAMMSTSPSYSFKAVPIYGVDA